MNVISAASPQLHRVSRIALVLVCLWFALNRVADYLLRTYLLFLTASREHSRMDYCNGGGEGSSVLIFLGTGCSSSVPRSLCLIQPSDPPCSVCYQSLSISPDRNPNYRFVGF